MQKKLLAVVVASMVAGQAMAITVVDDGTNTVSIGGHIGMRYVDQDKGDTAGDSSRINFGFENKLTQSTTAFAKAEWGFSTTSTGTDGDFFYQRLGYVGAKNDQFGSISFGKQWSSYAMVAGWTDMFATVGGDASGFYGADSEVMGTARADDAVQYNHSIAGLNISAQAQLGERRITETNKITDKAEDTKHDRESSYGIAASYDLPMGLSIGAAYNYAKADPKTGAPADEKSYKAKSAIVGAMFEADKIYAAFTYADLKNRDAHDYIGFAEKAKGYELYASYQLNDMFKFETGYNQLKDKSSNPEGKGEVKYLPVAVVYTQGPVQLSGTYQFEDSKKFDGTDAKDKIVLQARYYF